MGTFPSSTFYALSQQRLNHQVYWWKKELPHIKPYYAVKCNPEPWLMSWLAQRGIGFDCASAREISAVRRLPEGKKAEILFANPCKSENDLYAALIDSSVSRTVVDSHEEIEKLKDVGWKGTSLLRLRVDDKGSLMPFSAKFGFQKEDVETLANFATLKGQSFSGVSFHVGSACQTAEQYNVAMQEAFQALMTLQKKGHRATILDIGGGFTSSGFEEAAQVIRSTVDSFPFHVRVIAEPGRFFAQGSHDLFVRVIGKKPAASGKGWRYTLDESLYGQFSCIPFDHAQPRWIRVREKGEEKRASTPAVLYGRTCDSVDLIAAAESAEELMVGDMLWFPEMGAYTTVTSTEFNGFPKPEMIVLESHRTEQLPSPREFLKDEWPQGLRYVSPVSVPAV